MRCVELCPFGKEIYGNKRIYVGGNSGNLMFAYGVMNVLQTENTEFLIFSDFGKQIFS